MRGGVGGQGFKAGLFNQAVALALSSEFRVRTLSLIWEAIGEMLKERERY